MVYEYLLYREVLKLNNDDHWIILLMIDTMKMGVGECNRGHSESMMRTGNVVDGLYVVEVFLSSG